MNIARDTTGETINRIFNDPAVKPWVSDNEGDLDLRRLAQDPQCYALLGDPPLGAYVTWPVIEGVYEFHAGILPDGRNAWFSEFSEAAIGWMFCATPAVELITRVPRGYFVLLAALRQFGFACRWNCPEARFRGRPYSVWSLTMFDWLTADEIEAVIARMQMAGQPGKAQAWRRRHHSLCGPSLRLGDG